MIKVILLVVMLSCIAVVPLQACEKNKDLRDRLPEGVQFLLPSDVGVKQFASSDRNGFSHHSLLVVEAIKDTYFNFCKEDLQPTYYIWHFTHQTWKLLAKSNALFPNWAKIDNAKLSISRFNPKRIIISKFTLPYGANKINERYTFILDEEQQKLKLSLYSYQGVNDYFAAQNPNAEKVKYYSASIDVYGSGLSRQEGYHVSFDYHTGKGEMQTFTFARKYHPVLHFKVPKLKPYIEHINFSNVMQLPYVTNMVMLDAPKPKHVVKRTHIDAIKSFWYSLDILHKYHLSQPSYEVLLKIAEQEIKEEIKRRDKNLHHISKQFSDLQLTYKRDAPLVLVYEYYKKTSAAEADNFFYQIIASTLEAFDRDTYFYSPQEAEKLHAMASLGIQLDTVGEYPVVHNIVEGSSAENSGLDVGDMILKVDDKSMMNRNKNYLWLTLRDEEGKQVRLTVLKQEGVVATYQLTYEALKKESIETVVLDNALYIKFNQFEKETEPKLTKAIRKFCQKGACDNNGLIIDLRDNEGGLIRSVLQTLNLFLDKGSYVYSTQKHNKSVKVSKTWYVPRFPDVPVIILVSKHTASAAEMFTGAMQYHQRALIIGEATAGKGKISTLIPFTVDKQMFVVKVPTEEMLVVNHHLEGYGIQPNILYQGDKQQLLPISNQLLASASDKKSKEATSHMFIAVHDKKAKQQGLSVAQALSQRVPEKEAIPFMAMAFNDMKIQHPQVVKSYDLGSGYKLLSVEGNLAMTSGFDVVDDKGQKRGRLLSGFPSVIEQQSDWMLVKNHGLHRSTGMWDLYTLIQIDDSKKFPSVKQAELLYTAQSGVTGLCQSKGFAKKMKWNSTKDVQSVVVKPLSQESSLIRFIYIEQNCLSMEKSKKILEYKVDADGVYTIQ